IKLHGSLDQVRCMTCSNTFEIEDSHVESFEEGFAPECISCVEYQKKRIERGRRAPPVGFLRPNVVLYNENHPSGDIISSMVDKDIKRKPDLLIVMGTSLKVHGLKQLVKQFAKTVHS
ncbi:DHS-like NAD/FAD-binding domain-containing protein, partial [Rozella allomycis CSF55]